MKRFNIFYILLIPAIYLLYVVGSGFQSEGAFFYGFAENKETELNFDVDCMITKVHIAPGEEVKSGQLLLEANQAKFELKMSDLDFDLKAQEISTIQEKAKLQNQIAQLQIKKQSELAEVDMKIRSLESKITLNERLFEQISSITIPEESKQNTPSKIELDELRLKKQEIAYPIDKQLALLQEQLNKAGTPQKLNKQRINKEKELVNIEKEKLKVFAPTDGLIGNIHCIDGENVSSFNTLISFYERNPTLVKGFVHEKLILQVKIDDKLKVSSSQHPEHEVVGTVVGLGTRIVEIPERLRKIADFKTYGREVLIRIPSQNPFLQKEKVTLNSTNRKESNFISSFLNN